MTLSDSADPHQPERGETSFRRTETKAGLLVLGDRRDRAHHDRNRIKHTG